MAQPLIPTERAVDELERQRRHLEENIEKLNKSIRYWQTWEAEYEDLKEELQSLGDEASSSAIEEVGGISVGELLDQKEINLLLRNDKGQPQTSQQIIGLLSRRIEYVQSNVKSLRGSLEAAEGKMTASEALSQDQQNDEEGLPIMEIMEELDEDDNVLSSSITPASDAAPQIVEALRKAGVNGLPAPVQDKPPAHPSPVEPDDSKAQNGVETTPSILKQASSIPPTLIKDRQPSPSTSESDTKGDEYNPRRRRKSVTFADGTKQACPVEARPARDVQAAKARNKARRIKAEVRGSIDALTRVHYAGFIDEQVFDCFRREYVERLQDLAPTIPMQPPKRQVSNKKQQNPPVRSPVAEEPNPVMPENESPEDAALRREMIQYNMNEIGAVVAEMDLDDEDDAYSDPSSTGESNEDGEYQNSSDEDENKWGMSTGRVLTSDYISEMQALEKRLATQPQQNGGPHASIEQLLEAEDDLKIGENGKPMPKSAEATDMKQEKKTVRFATALDIQEHPPSPNNTNGVPPRKKASRPVHADVVERQDAIKESPGSFPPTPKKRVSRFKSSKLETQRSPDVPQSSAPLQIKAGNGELRRTPSLPAFTPPATPKMMPTGPAGRTHLPHVIERHPSDDADTEWAPAPDELDGSIMRQDLLMDYHRTRNRMIQRQGGFVGQDEEEDGEEGPLVDENGKKISRFKAARLRASAG
ncbi:MAG: hypothetical protein LQ350_005180 [Teloschistes chrysophthalmus]|nr:MAG: hypothetical protein LQ350_005180 [Niorma chrysophthalma]